jgi:hypothetical protein
MRTPQRKARAKTPSYPFHFLGFFDGWYALRNGMTAPDLQALALENDVVEWLIAQHITIGKWSWAGNGTVHPDRPRLPVSSDGSQFAVLFKRPADVLRFEMRFPCLGITPQTMLDAIRAEASKPRLTAEGIARVAYDAITSLATAMGTIRPSWEQISPEDRRTHIEAIRTRIANSTTVEHLSLDEIRDKLFASITGVLIPMVDD